MWPFRNSREKALAEKIAALEKQNAALRRLLKVKRESLARVSPRLDSSATNSDYPVSATANGAANTGVD